MKAAKAPFDNKPMHKKKLKRRNVRPYDDEEDRCPAWAPKRRDAPYRATNGAVLAKSSQTA